MLCYDYAEGPDTVSAVTALPCKLGWSRISLKGSSEEGIPDRNSLEKRQETIKWIKPGIVSYLSPTLALDHRVIKVSQACFPISGKGVKGVPVNWEKVLSRRQQD